MSADHGSTLQAVPDQKPVRIFIPIKGVAERYRASCIYKETDPPKFDLLFQPGILPKGSIDTSKVCYITIDLGGTHTSIEARIQDVENEQTLKMVAVKSFSPEQLRDFFRVDAQTSVISSSFLPEIYGEDGEAWSIKGKTIDISGSGLLASFTEKPPQDTQVKLDITLPSLTPEVVSVLARPVRTQKLEDNLYEVAYHFDDISAEHRDKIIGWCLNIQRKLLRLKVQVRGSDT